MATHSVSPCFYFPLEPAIRFHLSFPEPTLAYMCLLAGARYVGIQSPDAEAGFDGLVLFDEPNGSTLGVPLKNVNVSVIKRRMEEHAHAHRFLPDEPTDEYLRRLHG